MSEEEVLNAKMAHTLVSSLDEINEEDDNLYNKVCCYEKSYDSDVLDLNTEIDRLDDFSKTIIEERYKNDKTQEEISKALGITQVQVSRKEKEILTRLRTRLK